MSCPGRRLPAVLAIGVLYLAAAVPASAQSFEVLGARALGMAGAFVAVADDATAPYWNPAGLAGGAFLSLVLDRASHEARARDGRPAREASGTIVSIGVPALALSYYRLRMAEAIRAGAREGEGAGRTGLSEPLLLRSLVTQQVGVTLLQSLADGVALGATLKLVRGTAAAAPAGSGPVDAMLDRVSELPGSTTSTFDLDVGVMAGRGPVRAGLVVRNVRAPAFDARGGAVRLHRQVRAGLAVRPTEGLTIAVDADLTANVARGGDGRSVAVGVERSLGRRLAVRGGARASTRGDTPTTGAAGVSLGVTRALWLDGHLTRGSSGGDRGWGIAARVTF